MGGPWSPHPCNLTCDSKEQRKTRGTSQGASAVLDLQQQLAEELAKRKQAQYALLGGVFFFNFYAVRIKSDGFKYGLNFP